MMNQQAPVQESITVRGDHLVDRVKELLRDRHVRRIIVRHDGRIVVDLPLTVGIVGAVLAPELAALGAVAALLTECTIDVERKAGDADDVPPPPQAPVAAPE